MLIHWIWLSRLPRVNVKQKLLLLQTFRDPEEIYEARKEVFVQLEGITPDTVKSLLDKDLTEARHIINVCSEKNISILTYGDGAYPSRLKNIEQPPLVLYYKGCLPDWDNRPVIGVVGTRKASLYGLKNAERLGYEIASCGGLVVSGGADGIDGKAMEGAMSAGKRVVAVLGFGADVVYPAKHRELFAKVEKSGCLITEYIPGTPPNSWNFPQRNRIISGLSVGVLVVEAPERSGALNTAHHASDQGKDIFAMPGNGDSQCCVGSNQLLQERAMPAFSGWDVVREYESLYPQSVTRFAGIYSEAPMVAEEIVKPTISRPADKKSIDNREKSRYSVGHDVLSGLTPEENAVAIHLTNTPEAVDTIIAKTELPPARVLSILTKLAMRGVAESHPGKCYSLK